MAGQKMIGGKFTLPSNHMGATGAALNLANHFLFTSSPTVLCAAMNGFICEHNLGTAAASAVFVKCVQINGATLSNAQWNLALGLVADWADLSGVNIPFVAWGTAI
jgi:hypothetical protein